MNLPTPNCLTSQNVRPNLVSSCKDPSLVYCKYHYRMVAKKNHQRPPFRAEHLGSLLRPQKLVDKRVALDGVKTDVIAKDTELHGIEDEAINEIVKVQLDLGFHAVNDGEYRRHQFWGTFFPALEGMEEIENPPLDIFRLYVPDLAAFSRSSISQPQKF